MFSLADIVHFGLLAPPCTFPGIQIIRHSAYRFFALSSTVGFLLSELRQPSHPARIFSGILPDPFYLLPARRLLAHVTLVSFDKVLKTFVSSCRSSCAVQFTVGLRMSKLKIKLRNAAAYFQHNYERLHFG